MDSQNVSKGWGISANDDTVWLSGRLGSFPAGVVDIGQDAGLLSFDRRTGARESFQHANLQLRGLWSDGETVFAVDTGHDDDRPRVVAFDASNGDRDGSKEFNLSQGHYVQVKGIWGNNETIWVANDGADAGNKLFAYHRSKGARDSSKDFDTLHDAGNVSPRGIWSDGETMYVVDWSWLKVFAYRMSDKSRLPDRDIDLSEDHRNPSGVWGDGETLYVMDGGAELHAYDLTPGAVQYPRPPKKDRRGWIRILQAVNGGAAATGIWANDDTVWVADDYSNRVFAYDYAMRSNPRVIQSFRDDTLSGEGNEDPRDLWSDSETMFVLDRGDGGIYAYRMSDCMVCDRDHTVTEKDILLDSANSAAEGMWGNDETIWVANDGADAGNKLYAYRRSDGARDSSKDFDTLDGAGNNNPRAIWSDGQTMFVLDQNDSRVYAYSMDDKSHDPDKGVAFLGIGYTEGMWFDGYRLLVVAQILKREGGSIVRGDFSEVYVFILPGLYAKVRESKKTG